MVIQANKANAMGISGLLPFISDCKDDINIGQVENVDFSDIADITDFFLLLL